MKKAPLIFMTALALLAIMVIPVIAGGPKADKGDRGRSGKAAKPNVGDVSPGLTDDDDGGPPDGKGWKRDGAGKGGKSGPAGNSKVAHLYLREKDPSDWSIVEGGAWGKMKYNLSGPEFCFVFNGHGLEAGTDYSLIYYADFDPRFTNWGGDNPGALIATGTANPGGNIHLGGCKDLGMDLPSDPDWNIDPDPDYCDYHNDFDDYDHCSGAKIWLVPSVFYDAESPDPICKVISWQPTRFLFETDLITYTDTDKP